MRTFTRIVISTVFLLLTLTACSAPEQPKTAATAAPAAQVNGNLQQVMRGILFPNSNVIFATQSTNPADIKPASDPATATDPLQGAYGGWTAVENAGIAMAE